MNVFSLAKGLLKRLNQGKIQSNEFAPYKAKSINLTKKCCQVKAPTKYNTTSLVAYIVMPLWDKNDESFTINLQLQPNGKKYCTLICQLKKRDAYILCCKNHKCKVNTVNCALHCNRHNLVMDSSPQDF
jgi:hypothetical protein